MIKDALLTIRTEAGQPQEKERLKLMKICEACKVKSQSSKFLGLTHRASTTSSMAELPLFSEPKNSDDSVELSEIESLCTNCEQNVSFMMGCRVQSMVS